MLAEEQRNPLKMLLLSAQRLWFSESHQVWLSGSTTLRDGLSVPPWGPHCGEKLLFT